MSDRRGAVQNCGMSRRAGLASVLFAIAVLIAGCSNSAPAGTHSSATSSERSTSLNTGLAPWPAPDNVHDRIAAAGLTGADTEAVTVHYHAHPDIVVNRTPEPVAASIG